MLLTIFGILAGGIVSWAITHWYYKKQVNESTDPAEALATLNEKLENFATLQSYTTEKIITTLGAGGDLRTVPSEYGNPRLNALPALNILCQGYLAVYAETHSDSAPLSEPVDKALKHMGWHNFKDKEKISNNLETQLDLIQKPEWWNDCISPEDSSQAIREIRSLSSATIENITQLLDQVASGKGTITPDIVARAYVTSANLMLYGTLKEEGAEQLNSGDAKKPRP